MEQIYCAPLSSLLKIENARQKVYGKWKLAILFMLYRRAYRFNMLKSKLNVAPNVLVNNLRDLEQHGLVLKLEGSYCLTEKARRIAALIIEIEAIVNS